MLAFFEPEAFLELFALFAFDPIPLFALLAFLELFALLAFDAFLELFALLAFDPIPLFEFVPFVDIYFSSIIMWRKCHLIDTVKVCPNSIFFIQKIKTANEIHSQFFNFFTFLI